MQVVAPTVAAAPYSQTKLRVLDLQAAAPLHPLAGLDIVADGRLDALDGQTFDALSDAARGAADVELSEKLHWAGQQARYGAAMLDPEAPLPTTTIHNIVPTPDLASVAPVAPGQLIQTIRSVDTDTLRAAGVRPVATFDIDGTSIKGDIFIPFAELMATKSRFGEPANEVFKSVLTKLDVDQSAVTNNDANANALLMLSKIDPTTKVDTPTQLSIATAFFTVGDAMVGQRLDDVRGVAREMMEHGTPSTKPYKLNVNDDSAASGDSINDVVAALADNGIEPFVVTYGFDWLAKEAVGYAGFDPDKLIGTHSEVVDGVFTGRHNGVEIPSKDVLTRQATGSPPLFVFGDSGSDLPMLDIAVARGVVVNPTSSMQAKMAERGGALSAVRFAGTVGTVARS